MIRRPGGAWRASAELTAIVASLTVGGCYPSYAFDLNDAGPSCGGTFEHPAASSFLDDFDGVTVGAGWVALGPCAEVDAGEVVISLPPGDTPYCTYGTVGTYHLTCDSVSVKVTETTTPVQGPQTVVYVVPQGGDQLSLVLEGGNFYVLRMSTDERLVGAGAYDAKEDLWWRLGESNGDVVFATSPDGTTWNERGRAQHHMDLDAVQIQIGAGTYFQLPDPGRAKFDCYNVKPPCP